MDPKAVQRRTEVAQRVAPQVAPRDVHPMQVGPGEQVFAVRRPEGVRHGDAAVKLVQDVLVTDPRVAKRHQQRQ